MARKLTVAESLRTRRTTHHFDPNRPLEAGLLVRILEMAAGSPSGHNLQPWRFLVVRDRSNRARIRRSARTPSRFAEAPVVVIVLAYLYPHRTHLEPIVDEMVRRGLVDPAGARAIRGRAGSSMERLADPELWAIRSGMLASMALLMAAESEGVGSALVEAESFDLETLRGAFGIPDDHAICCLIGLGHPRDPEPSPSPGRLPIGSVCFGEHFGRAFDPDGAGSEQP